MLSSLGTYDFTDYSNLLTKVEETDAKVSELGSEVYSSIHGKNLFNKATITEGYFLTSSGNTSANVNYFYSDYIPVKPTKTYYINKAGVGGCYVIYDENKVKVTAAEQTAGAITIPDNGYYLRVSTTLSNASILQVELGTQETAYEDYYESNQWYNWYMYASQITGGSINSNPEDIVITSTDYVSGFLSNSGGISSNDGFVTTDFIELPLSLVGIDVVGIFTNQYGGGVCFYDSDKIFLASIYNVGSLSSANEYHRINLIDIPIGSKYVRSCAIKKGNYEVRLKTYSKDGAIAKLIENIESNSENIDKNKKSISEISNEIDSFANFRGKNLFNKATITEGYFFSHSGVVSANENYFYSDYIPVKPTKTYYINKAGVGGGYVIYDENKVKVTAAEQTAGAITIPDNGYYLRVSTRLSYLDTLQVELGTQETAYEDYYEGNLHDVVINHGEDIRALKDREDVRYFRNVTSESFVEGNSIEIPDTPNIKNKHSIAFRANIITMGKIRISHGTDAYIAGIIEVDNTNIYVYNSSKPTEIISTIPHGLTISSYIHIRLRILDKFHKGTIDIITSNGQSYSSEIDWNGSSQNAMVTCISGQYLKCKLVFGGDAWKEKVWIFGDSYTDYWPKYMEEIGSNYLLDGFSGRSSNTAYTSLINNLKYGSPDILVWMMGMNDPDSDDGINDSYKRNFDNVRILCKSKGILFIPCTIPNTPTRNHIFKNEYITDSEYFIDIAEVLGAETEGSLWHDNLLGSDNVHPTNNGAKLIAMTLAEEIPQLASK